ncbi:hypothetical protein [Dongshaea marina]|uniref:hypothetical protein n=1 Tax=Dongshaea marina TaxID=2047966 RepID=UPI000D3E703D|nr:hypothetical protein [Dongshaea marina]
MSEIKPELIAINHDEYYAKHIGVTPDGLQFFLTNPFEPDSQGKKGCEYIALFKFDEKGNLVDSEIEALGPRGFFSDDDAREKYYSRLESLGNVNYQRIEVKPFCVKYNDTNFGLIAREPEYAGDIWAALFPKSMEPFGLSKI